MIRLEKAVDSDCSLLHRLQIWCFQPLLEKYQDYDTNPGAESLEKIKLRFGQEYTDYYLIYYRDTVVGMLRVCNYGRRCRLSPICILPEYQGRGFAQAAMREMERLYPEAKTWELDTILQEEKLCRLYEKMGYVRTGEYHRIQQGMDLVFYRKHL